MNVEEVPLTLVLMTICDDVIYYHFKKLSVDQASRLCNLPSKSYSKINVAYTSGDDMVKESRQSISNGFQIKVIDKKQKNELFPLLLLSLLVFLNFVRIPGCERVDKRRCGPQR